MPCRRLTQRLIDTLKPGSIHVSRQARIRVFHSPPISGPPSGQVQATRSRGRDRYGLAHGHGAVSLHVAVSHLHHTFIIPEGRLHIQASQSEKKPVPGKKPLDRGVPQKALTLFSRNRSVESTTFEP